MVKVITELPVAEFIRQFVSNFPSYSQHKIESWYINTVKNAGTSSTGQLPNTLICVSDFAQNVKLLSKHETSEEYFHKTQISIHATVSTVNVPKSLDSNQQHSFSQITASNNKSLF